MKRLELVENIFRKGSFLCVGLDTDLKKIPQHLLREDDPVFAFNKAIIDATAPYCIAYKPNLAFYECMGARGWESLARTVNYLRENYPDQFIIADAKRGDIGNTAAMYARTFFDELGVDAVTVAPYMGQDSVTPFLDHEGKWAVVLALTSNKGCNDFQLTADEKGRRLFERVLARASKWGSPVNTMFVVGATRGELIADARKAAPRSFFLVPGVGAQGGSLDEVVKYAMNDECGLIVNSSRGIIYASDGEDFAERAGDKARDLAEQMKAHLQAAGLVM